jgi:catechol O-methyltransferase
MHSNGVPPSSWSTLPAHSSASDQTRVGYFCVEQDKEYAAVARVAIEVAGLSDYVKILVGPSSATLKDIRKTLSLPSEVQFDMVFLDHYKPLYTTDVKILEQDQLVGLGTILVADNVIKPGNPPYLAYVRATPEIKRRALEKQMRVIDIAPELATRHEKHQDVEGDVKRSMSTGYEGKEQGISEERGEPNFVYTSELLESWDPYTAERDGVEVSRIVGIDN